MNARIPIAATLFVCAVVAAPLSAQEAPRPLEHADYDRWERITDEVMSRDGERLAWVLQPGEGDGTLLARALPGGEPWSLERGAEPGLTGDGAWLVALVRPRHDVVDSLRRADVDDDDLPGDSLAIVDLGRAVAGGGAAGEAVVAQVPDVLSFRLPERGAYLAYRLDDAAEDDEAEDEGEGEGGEGREGGEDDEDEGPPRTDPGSTLVLRSLETGDEHRFPHATDYRFTDDGRWLYYAASSPEGAADGAYRVDTGTGEATALLEGEGRYLGLVVQEDGHAAAFLSDTGDRARAAPRFTVYHADASGPATPVAGPEGPGIRDGWGPSEHGDLSISANGERVFFGTASLPEDEEESDLLDDERVEVDIWNWKDPYLQPMQLVQAEDERERTYEAWAPPGGGEVVQLETPELESVNVGSKGDATLAVGADNRAYRQLVSWDDRYADAWLVDVATGERRQVAEKLRDTPDLSPDEEWLTWWDGEARAWFALPTDGDGGPVSMTAGIDEPVHDVLDDRPEPPGSYGFAGWTEGDGMAVLYGQHDIWGVDPRNPDAPRNLTGGAGEREGIRFRWARLDEDRETVPMNEPVLLSAFSPETKQDGFYRHSFGGQQAPERLVFEDAEFGNPDKAADADRLLFTRETFREYPDLWVSGPELSDRTKVTAANADLQDEVRWGTAEIVEWTSSDGIPLQGILYKPDGFDPSRQYPMMVYFYERSSDGLHGYHVPSAGGSSINRSFYVSRGYLLFVPDIPYQLGYPGESALDAIVPGVLALQDEGFVDPERIGVQGHSWGGYQIAWMITRTNLFAAAEAGAPVANMTSAYGGIRWGTGMSRMFQYERTQSRIGGSLWERPLLYIENSPLFAADKIETPLLMMHNDEDTAVPWEQGIEMFVALRRLGKPVWMLNYNDEAHGLGREANRKDWAIRMQQFFDHYLMDAPPPVWMEHGVPAVEKGETLGLELVEEPVATEAGSRGGGGGR